MSAGRQQIPARLLDARQPALGRLGPLVGGARALPHPERANPPASGSRATGSPPGSERPLSASAASGSPAAPTADRQTVSRRRRIAGSDADPAPRPRRSPPTACPEPGSSPPRTPQKTQTVPPDAPPGSAQPSAGCRRWGSGPPARARCARRGPPRTPRSSPPRSRRPGAGHDAARAARVRASWVWPAWPPGCITNSASIVSAMRWSICSAAAARSSAAAARSSAA